MPATTEADLSEGLEAVENDGKLTVVRLYHVKDLELPNVGDPEVMRFLAALSAPGIPSDGATLIWGGRTLEVTNRRVKPFPPNSADVTVTYTEQGPLIAGYGPTTIRGGSTLEQGLTEFDFANLQLPWNQRVPIQVAWDPNSTGAPGTSAFKQAGAVPILICRSAQTWTRTETSDPSGRSRQYTGRTNTITWKGMPAGTALMLAVTYESDNSGSTYRTSYTVAYEPAGFQQGLRFILPESGKPPVLSATQVAAENGIKVVTVQGTADFTGLGL